MNGKPSRVLLVPVDKCDEVSNFYNEISITETNEIKASVRVSFKGVANPNDDLTLSYDSRLGLLSIGDNNIINLRKTQLAHQVLKLITRNGKDLVKEWDFAEIEDALANGSDSMLTLLKKVSQMDVFGTSNPSVSRIEHILKNPFYYGEMRVKGELYPHKYTPIIDKDLFIRASERRIINFTGGKHTNKNYIFKDVFKCGKCGHQICGDGPKKKNIYYRCANQWCQTYNKSVNEKQILEIWMEILKTLIVPDEVIQMTVDTLKTAVQAKTDYKMSRLRTLRLEWDRIENRIEKIYLDKLDGLISDIEYKKYTAQFKGRQNEIRQEESNFDFADDNFYLEAEKALNFASNLYNLFYCLI